MASSKNITIVQNISESLKKAKALVLADYKGLNMAQMSELRSAVKKAGGDFEVTKNTLLRLAAESSKFKVQSSKFNLTGPTATLWVFEDNPAPIKAFVEFTKQTGLPKVKFGIWEGEPVSAERIFQLASLPSLKELQAQLVGRLQSPISGLVFSLNSNLQKLVIVLKAASTKVTAVKGGEN